MAHLETCPVSYDLTQFCTCQSAQRDAMMKEMAAKLLEQPGAGAYEIVQRAIEKGFIK